MKIYVISLKNATERRAFMQRQLNKLGLDFEFFDAINGNDIAPNEIKNLLVKQSVWARYSYNPITPGELGCSLSHRAILKKIAGGDDEYAVIFEDDAKIEERFLTFLEELPSLKLNWDIISLTSCRRPVVKLATLGNDIEFGCPKYAVYRSMAYVIKKEACEKFLASYPRISRPIDNELQCWWENGLKVIVTKPEVIGDSEFVAQSQLNAMGRNKSKARKSSLQILNKRRLYRLKAAFLKRSKFSTYVASMKPGSE